MTETIGLLAAILTTVCYMPQAWHVIRTRHTAGISLLAYVTLFGGVSLWLVYGILLHDIPLMLANGLTLPMILIVIVIKIRHK
jgi:MtN3 and saliva related transmembrane protein